MPTFAFAVPVPLAGSENYYIGALGQPYERNNNTPSLAGCMEMDGYRWEIPVVSARNSSSCRLAPWLLSFVTLHESSYPRRIPHIIITAAPLHLDIPSSITGRFFFFS